MSTEKSIIKDISFFSDGFKLRGSLHLPSVNRPPVVIGSHGLYSSSSSPKQIALADQCNRFGIAYFRFDHRGCGCSEGKFEAVTSLEARCKDLADAVAVITGTTDTGDRFGLFGSSMGGTVCLSVAGELGVHTLVTFAAPIRSRIMGTGLPMFKDADTPGIFLDAQNRRFDITDRLPGICNILIFHGEADDVVPVSHAEEIYNLAKQPKKLIKQEQGDHPMSNEAHQKTFVKEAVLWFQSGLKGN
jgi:alpha-beta hydrolase superfamily lysophospholipase